MMWYIFRNGQQEGPLSAEDIGAQIAAGTLQGQDLLWREGMSEWSTVDSEDMFVAAFQPPPPEPVIQQQPQMQPVAVFDDTQFHPVETAPEPESSPAAAKFPRSSPRFSRASSVFEATRSAAKQEAAPKKRHGYLRRHWRGELPLWQSFWMNTLLPVVVIGGVIGALSIFPVIENPRMVGIVMLALLVFCIPMSLWQWVGQWRASTAYLRIKTGKKRSWAWAVRSFVAGAVVLSIFQLPTATLPQMKEFAYMAQGKDSLGAPVVVVNEDGSTLLINGPISFGTADRVATQLRMNPSIFMLHLESAGGRITEARRLREIVSAHNLTTYSLRECLSACTMVFAAGTERLLGPKARIGFHQYSFPGLRSEDLSAEFRADTAYYIGRGFDKALLDQVAHVPPETLWLPTPEELLRSRFITGYASSDF